MSEGEKFTGLPGLEEFGNHKSGFVAVIGKPNAGKSTLMNAMVGGKLSIVTPKAQTTRHRIMGIASGEDFQIVFSDTPGVIRPKYGLHKAMMSSVHKAMGDADLILFIVDVKEKFPEEDVLEIIKNSRIPVMLVVNKIDLASEEEVATRKKELEEKVNPVTTVLISALNQTNLGNLKESILAHLPFGPPYYDKETLSDRPERFFVTEIIREKLFLNLDEELPYSCEVTLLEFEDKEDVAVIHAEIHVERKSQKGMVIGAKGRMIKKIGTEARKTIEEFLDKKVFLELYVRVAEDWKDSDFRLNSFGYKK